MTIGIQILTRRGVVHKGAEMYGQRLSDERCNVDDANVYAVSATFLTSDSRVKRHCKRCFPEDVP